MVLLQLDEGRGNNVFIIAQYYTPQFLTKKPVKVGLGAFIVSLFFYPYPTKVMV